MLVKISINRSERGKKQINIMNTNKIILLSLAALLSAGLVGQTTATTRPDYDKWHIEMGMAVGILSSEPYSGGAVNSMVPVCFAINFGYYFLPNHRLSLEINPGAYKDKIGTFSYTKTIDGKSKDYTDGKIHRRYGTRFNLLSYQWVLTPTEKFHIRMGPSLGTIVMNATTVCTPTVDNAPPKNKTSEFMGVYGLGLGFIWKLGENAYIDSGYRFMSGKGLELDEFELENFKFDKVKVTTPAHLINLTLGFRF